MDDESISYEMLQDLLRAERRSNKLTPVKPRFWSRVRDFLVEVTTAFRTVQEEDPFSRKAMMLRDEVQHARQTSESLWALRERKMALYALAQVKDEKADRPAGLTRVEEELYDTILATLRAGRARVLDGNTSAVKAAPAPSAPATPAPAATPVTSDEVPVRAEPDAEPPAQPTAPAVVPPDRPSEDMVTIRATADIPPFVGPDMQTYLLKEGDVAMVPPAIAQLLARRGKAEALA